MDWKVGDWVIFDCNIGQIKELRDADGASFTDGFFETSGRLVDRFRPLTLRNKRIAECFKIYYRRLKDIDGEAGFNYPRISQHLYQLALDAIDHEEIESSFHEKAHDFVREAREYKPIIQGVALFRPK